MLISESYKTESQNE